MSPLKNVLTELYCNVFDHAEANGNAFSYVSFDEQQQKISVAICDFGRGIASSLKSRYNITDDGDALRKSIEQGISARTQIHNRGFGLDNVVSILTNDNEMRIVSNQALLYISIKDDERKLSDYNFGFEFKGTLIYFDGFEEEEIMDEFSL